MNIVKKTLYISLTIQILTLLFGYYTYINNTKEEVKTLRDILLIENIVQFVEFSFYVLIVFVFTNIATKDLAKYRYIDWAITTPLMLITTLLYFVFISNWNNPSSLKETHRQDSVVDIIKKEKNNIIKMTLSNAGMLLTGYLQELKIISLSMSNIVGFGFLVYVFYILYGYVTNNTTSILFWVMFFVWSLYGVASNFNDNNKNASYNILDIISKNFYGVFLAYMVMSYN